MFAVSDKVVYVGECIAPTVSDNPGVYRVVGYYPAKDCVYTVEALPSEDGLALVGSTVIATDTGQELGWCCRAFRKLDEIKAENALRASLQAIADATFSKPATIRIGPSS